METQKELYPKQCVNEAHSNIYQIGLHQNSNSAFFNSENFSDQPIDLTITTTNLRCRNREHNVNFIQHNDGRYNEYKNGNSNVACRLDAQPFQIINCPEMIGQKTQYDDSVCKKRKRRKFVYTDEGNLVLVTEDSFQDPQAFTQAKQIEILKAAKSLFSKRTRTLYHWMYPAASKQQIKTTVLTSWDSLAESEKAFYISQVLGRFGLSQSSLMINPQLDSIKELPPIIQKVEQRPTYKELQNAITSITPDPSFVETNINSLTFEEFEAMKEKTRKRRGRPRGNTMKKLKSNREDFHDDPELSQELEKFAIKFNLSRLY